MLVLTSLFPVHEVASHAFLSVVYSFSAQSVPLAPAASIVLQRRYATLDPAARSLGNRHLREGRGRLGARRYAPYVTATLTATAATDACRLVSREPLQYIGARLAAACRRDTRAITCR